MKLLGEFHANTGTQKVLNSELWHACAGPLVSLPQPGSLVYYFPQGHSEQVSISTRRTINSQIPSYPNLPSQLMCQVHNVTLHADRDTDEIYAQMTLRPVNSEADIFQIPDSGYTKSTQTAEFFCKNLTASDTSTHGGFSVPRRAAEKLFPQLDYAMQPPNQELIVRDLHENVWTFRHIYRGQPKRHLLTTGWSLFVGAKHLKAGDSVLFIRDEKSQLLLGLRRASCQQTAFPSSVLSADSMHIGVLAAAAHAVASSTPFTIYYNPRACPSEFIIPLAKYHKAAFVQVSVGMKFGMMFATEESIKRRAMGTIVGISDSDSLRWPNSKWRNLQVEWDEPSSDQRLDRVSIWEIETPESIFVVPPHLKRRCLPGFIDVGTGNLKQYAQASECRSGNRLPFRSGLDSELIMKMLRKQERTLPGAETGCHQSVYATILQNIKANGLSAASSCASQNLMTMQGAFLTEGKIIEAVMREKSKFIASQEQAVPLEDTSLEYKNTYDCLEQQGLLVETKLDSLFSAESPWRIYQELDEHDSRCEDILFKAEIMDKKSEIVSNGAKNGRMERTQTKVKISQLLNPECIRQLTGNYERASPVTLPGNDLIKNDNFRSSVVSEDKEVQASRLNDLQIYQQQPEQSTGRSQCIETANSLNKNNLLDSLPYHGFQLYNYSDNQETMIQPSLYQSFADAIKAPDLLNIPSRTSHLFVPAVENDTSPSVCISPILNLEDLNPFETCHFSSSSYSFAPTFMPVLVEEPYDSREISPSEGISVPDIQSFHAQNLRSIIKENVPPELLMVCGLRDVSGEGNNLSEACSNLHSECSNADVFTDSSVPSTVLEEFSVVKGSSRFRHLSSNHDIQSQVTSANLVEPHVFSLQDIPESSGGTSSGNIDANDCNYFGKPAMKQVVQQPMRTYTKVQKLGSVGRSIDLKRFQNYGQLKSAIACMFGLQGHLDDSKRSGWKLVYVDQENDVLLVGDDPWDEFINCVRCIRILSPSEVEQMSQEGLQFINSYQS